MKFENIRIQRKLMTVILITCATVLLITCSIYYMYERFALRRALVHQMTMLGDIIAANSTAALAFENTEDAREILSSLAVEENIRAACLYDDKGQLFSWYPENAIKQDLPKTIGAKGYEFHNTYISGFQPVFQENRFLGTLYIRSDLKILQEQNRLFGQVVILVIILSFILSYLVSQVSQNVISKPILKLAETAHLISNNKDYSIRAPKLGNDELGRLTDSFNNMLEMIDKQNKVLKENEERTRSVINSSLNAVILMDVNGSITEWSIRAEKMFGWTSEEAIGRELAETIIPHEYRKAHRTGLTNYLKSGEYNLMNKPTEMSALRRNGKIFPIQLSVTEIKNDGESTFCGFITDITEQKRAEEDLKKGKMLLENIVQSMGDAYISLDREWRYTYVNDKALSLMGKSGKDLLGKVLWKVFPDAIGSVFDTEYHKAMMHKVPVSFETYDSPNDIWMEIRAYPNDDGLAIFYSDITKFKKTEEDIRLFNQILEQKVKTRTKELELANKELESFSYSVSHDLRAPLRAINGYISILSEDFADSFDEEGKEILQTIRRNSKKMGMLIDDLLEFSRLGRTELTKSKLPMTQLVKDIFEELRKLENNHVIELKLRPLPQAFADGNTIRQVWGNLISNALKYSRKKDKAVIEIGSYKKAKANVYFVRDNGAGFDMKYYEKLFGVFQRLHSIEEFEGTGVGLAIVHRIISKHNGKIWAKGKLGEGATFYFTLNKNVEA